MIPRKYYSVRNNKNLLMGRLDLDQSKKLFLAVHEDFQSKHYFDEAFGYYCVDFEHVRGTAGSNVDAFFLRRLRKDGLWPIPSRISLYHEDDLFDVIELLFDCISEPVEGYEHTYNNCGMHYTSFDRQAGQDKCRAEINSILVDYADGFELSKEGEILALADSGLQPLLEAKVPQIRQSENIERRVQAAVLKYRHYRSSVEDRKEAIRSLADVLEYLRPQIKEVLTSKDEGDLFNIANNFGIRHHNPDQKTDYDQGIWFSWIFYYYLATIHAALRLIEKRKKTAP